MCLSHLGQKINTGVKLHWYNLFTKQTFLATCCVRPWGVCWQTSSGSVIGKLSLPLPPSGEAVFATKKTVVTFAVIIEEKRIYSSMFKTGGERKKLRTEDAGFIILESSLNTVTAKGTPNNSWWFQCICTHIWFLYKFLNIDTDVYMQVLILNTSLNTQCEIDDLLGRFSRCLQHQQSADERKKNIKYVWKFCDISNIQFL